MRKSKLLIPLLCFALIIIIFRFVIFIGYVPSESMEPTIHAGDMIIGTRIFCDLNVGNIIIFEHGNRIMVKRIVACPGDTIYLLGKKIKVPQDCYYVLGDNSANSFDSRYWENPYVKRDNVIAKLLKINYDHM